MAEPKKKITFPSNDWLEQFRRQSLVERFDATRVNNNISVKVDTERKLKRANKRIANEHTAKHFAKKEADRDREAKRAALESLNKLNSILGIPLLNIEYGPQATDQGTIQDGWQAKIDKAYSDYGMSNALGQMTNVSDAWRATPSFGRFVGKDVPTSMIVAGGLATNPVGTALGFGTGYLGGQVGGVVGSKYFNNEEAGEIIGSFAGFPFGYKLGRPLTYALEALPNFSRNYRLSRAINNAVDNGVLNKTVRLYRATGTSGKFEPSKDGTAEFSGMWFTDNRRKPLMYASQTAKTARRTGENNPIELLYVDIPESELSKYKASNLLKGRTDIEYEPTEDYLIPLNFLRKSVPMEGYTGNLLLDTRKPLPVKNIYTSPNVERLDITTAEPLMSASKGASSTKGVKIPPSKFHPRKLSDGRYVINDPDNPGKSILWDKYLEKTGQGQTATNLGYDPQQIAEQATKDFNNSILQRVINENKLLSDLADKIKSGKATTQFATGRRTIVNPSSRDVLAGEYLDATKGKRVRGVGLVNTTPVEVTTTGEEVYAGRGNFGVNSFSVTDSKRASTKYGAIDYEKLTNDTQHSKVLTDLEKNEIFDIMKRMKEIDKNPLPKMKDNTQGKFKVTPEEELEYISLGERLNELVPGTFEYGAKNRHILFRAPEEKLILDISSTNNNFGHQKETLGLNLFDYRNAPVESYTPAGNLKSGNFGNIVDAERTIGGYYKDSPLYGRQLIKGWNQSDKVMELLKLRYPHLFPLKIPKNYRFYVRGTGPNGVPGDVDMVTLQAPNGGVPGFKFGNKLNYYKKYKSKFLNDNI